MKKINSKLLNLLLTGAALLLAQNLWAHELGEFVWFDANANGRQDPGEPGVPNVLVQVVNCEDNTIVAWRLTDANGHYEFYSADHFTDPPLHYDFFTGEPLFDQPWSVPFGPNYKIRFTAPAGYAFTTPYQGLIPDPNQDQTIDPAVNPAESYVKRRAFPNENIDDSKVDPATGETPCFVFPELATSGAFGHDDNIDCGLILLTAQICGQVSCLSGEAQSPIANAVVVVINTANTYTNWAPTDAAGHYCITLPAVADSYTACVLPQSLPPSVNSTTPNIPAEGFIAFEVTENGISAASADFVFSCGGSCWLTAGGVKTDAGLESELAQASATDSMGGNVYPECSATAGDGGQWNHISHSARLHFLGRSMQVVGCGNVAGIPPGSDSPQTPYNFIEFTGTGTLKGIKGNMVNYGLVYFFARCEDRNEPGSNGANDGASPDRYFLHVYTNPADPVGSTKLLFDSDGDPATCDPAPVAAGNLQIHTSGCQ